MLSGEIAHKNNHYYYYCYIRIVVTVGAMVSALLFRSAGCEFKLIVDGQGYELFENIALEYR